MLLAATEISKQQYYSQTSNQLVGISTSPKTRWFTFENVSEHEKSNLYSSTVS